jgi:hypothetical protein
MNIRKALIAVLLGLNLTATAEIVTISRAYEVRLSDFLAPASYSGSVTFKPCFSCDAKTVRVLPETQYVLNGRSIELKEFKKSLALVSNRAAETVIVKHHLESDTVVSVSITL